MRGRSAGRSDRRLLGRGRESWDDETAAGDVQTSAGDERGLVGEQPQDRLGDFVGSGDAVDGNGLAHRRQDPWPGNGRLEPYWPRERYLELAPKHRSATRARLRPEELDAPLFAFEIPPADPAPAAVLV